MAAICGHIGRIVAKAGSGIRLSVPPALIVLVAWRAVAAISELPVNHVITAEPIEMPFGRLILVGPRNHVLDWVKVSSEQLSFLSFSYFSVFFWYRAFDYVSFMCT